jgi:hypothetical protein
MTPQEKFDKEIRNTLSSFLQSNNSVSGDSFIKLIESLNTIKLNWRKEVEDYIKNIKS